jgi:GntR family transcriptional regulator/MocR family aminotransferase
VGSFSKTMAPMLRIGFLVAPASLRSALRTAKQLTDWHGDVIAQAALAAFLDEGLLARHVRKTTREYAARHALVASTVEQEFPWLTVVESAAGLHLCAWSSVDVGPVGARARAAGVGVQALADFCLGPVQQGLVIGYGAISQERITEGLRRLAAVFTG